MASNGITPEEVAERVGREPNAEFEVRRGTDTETVETVPESVTYGTVTEDLETTPAGFAYTPLPLVIFEFNKYHAGLPPWYALDSFTLHGDESAEFDAPSHHETKITGNLKTVGVTARGVQFKSSDYRVK